MILLCSYSLGNDAAGRERQTLQAAEAMVAITAFLYLEGWAAWYAWPVLVLLVAASMGGYWFRLRPNVTVWRLMYIMGFACWMELAWIFGWVVVMAVTPQGPYVLSKPGGQGSCSSWLLAS